MQIDPTLAALPSKPNERVAIVAINSSVVGSFIVVDVEEDTDVNETLVDQLDGTLRRTREYRRRFMVCPAQERAATPRETAQINSGIMPANLEVIPQPKGASSHYHRQSGELAALIVKQSPRPENAAPLVPWWMAANLIERGLVQPASDADASKLQQLAAAYAKAA